MNGRNMPPELPARVRLARWIGHQHWMPKGQDALLRAIIHPDAGHDLPFEVDFFGYRYRGNIGNFLDWTVLLYGASAPSELSVLDRISRYLRSQSGKIIYLDIGVNVGHHLLFMSGLADRCYGIDPNESVLSRASEKIKLNQIKNAKVYNVALGDKNQRRPYFLPMTANEGTGSFLRDWSSANSGAAVSAEVRQASEFLAEEGITGVNIIKIDVEGFEAAVLRGLKQVLAKERPFVLLELSAKGLNEMAGEAGFRSWLYADAKVFLVKGDHRFRYSLEPHHFNPRNSEVLIVPPEHLDAFRRTCE